MSSEVVGRVFGDPYERPDGSTVIPVSRICGGSRPKTVPLGVFVIHDGKASWTPAVDGSRLAMGGLLVGLTATVLSGIAMVRRPPWPDIIIRRRDLTD